MRSFNVIFDLHLNKRLSNNRDAGDLRRHRANHDVTLMQILRATRQSSKYTLVLDVIYFRVFRYKRRVLRII